MDVKEAEKCWSDFTAQQQQSGGQPATGNGNGNDPGTVYFHEADKGQTQVTMQLNSDGIADGDEQTLGQRVDGFLGRFKEFVENR
jgi:hypothetical protein